MLASPAMSGSTYTEALYLQRLCHGHADDLFQERMNLLLVSNFFYISRYGYVIVSHAGVFWWSLFSSRPGEETGTHPPPPPRLSETKLRYFFIL